MRASGARAAPLGSTIRREGVRAVLYQFAAALLVGGACYYLIANAVEALGRMGVATGYEFLSHRAGFGIGESVIPYTASDTYLRAFLVGLLNTLRVSALGIVLATLVGLAVGLGRLSRNLFVSSFASLYVQVFRNTPQLLQIVFWYALATHLPRPRQALQPLPGVFLSNRGVFFPWIGADGIDWPALQGLAIRGGAHLTPEFLALLLGLGLYIGAFLAEIVRAGVLSVPKGDLDAARALGLRPFQVQRLVVLPQALRLMIPPATGQYVSLVKNSSLAVAIGYPDLVNIGNTTINQTGQVVEGILMIMAVYVTISLVIAAAMNRYNRVVMTRLARA